MISDPISSFVVVNDCAVFTLSFLYTRKYIIISFYCN